MLDILNYYKFNNFVFDYHSVNRYKWKAYYVHYRPTNDFATASSRIEKNKKDEFQIWKSGNYFDHGIVPGRGIIACFHSKYCHSNQIKYVLFSFLFETTFIFFTYSQYLYNYMQAEFVLWYKCDFNHQGKYISISSTNYYEILQETLIEKSNSIQLFSENPILWKPMQFI